MAPASLASRTSRDSRSASFLISSADSALPSRTPPLMTRLGLSLAKSRRPFADSTGSPVTKATAVGPLNRSSSVVIPASLAAILVSVFFTTAYWAFSPSDRRSVLSCATVRPRYSVSTAAFELRNCSVSSATEAALSGLAISVGLLPGDETARKGLGKRKRPGTGARGVARPVFRTLSGGGLPGALPHSPARAVRVFQRILRPPHSPGGHGNDQRSLASPGEYATGSPPSKSASTTSAPTPASAPGVGAGPQPWAPWASFIISARSAVSLAG